MYKYVEIPKGKDELFNKFDELAIFNGEVCYALRCAYLHSGNYELKECDKSRIKISRFELCISDCECVSGDAHGCSISNNIITEVHRRFNVEKLIKYFILGTEDYIKRCRDNSNRYATINIIKL